MMSLIRQRLPSLSVLISLLLGACASPPPPVASAAEDARAKAFAPPLPGQAVVYFYRDGSYDFGGNLLKIIVDGREVGWMRSKTFFSISVEPGAHDVWVELGGMVFTPITVIAGQTYFVSVGVTDEANKAVNSETGKLELLACCKLAVPQSIAPAMPTLFQ